MLCEASGRVLREEGGWCVGLGFLLATILHSWKKKNP